MEEAKNWKNWFYEGFAELVTKLCKTSIAIYICCWREAQTPHLCDLCKLKDGCAFSPDYVANLFTTASTVSAANGIVLEFSVFKFASNHSHTGAEEAV